MGGGQGVWCHPPIEGTGEGGGGQGVWCDPPIEGMGGGGGGWL